MWDWHLDFRFYVLDICLKTNRNRLEVLARKELPGFVFIEVFLWPGNSSVFRKWGQAEAAFHFGDERGRVGRPLLQAAWSQAVLPRSGPSSGAAGPESVSEGSFHTGHRHSYLLGGTKGELCCRKCPGPRCVFMTYVTNVRSKRFQPFAFPGPGWEQALALKTQRPGSYRGARGSWRGPRGACPDTEGLRGRLLGPGHHQAPPPPPETLIICYTLGNRRPPQCFQTSWGMSSWPSRLLRAAGNTPSCFGRKRERLLRVRCPEGSPKQPGWAESRAPVCDRQPVACPAGGSRFPGGALNCFPPMRRLPFAPRSLPFTCVLSCVLVSHALCLPVDGFPLFFISGWEDS